MSAPRYSVADYARATDPVLRRLAGMVRRMAVDVTAKTLWNLLGHKLDDGTDEAVSAEVFPGIGFYARPKAGAKPEAIVLHVGGADHPVIVALRDEGLRQAAAGSLAADESAVFNSTVTLVMKANGTIEARTINGAAAALATKADIDALIATFNTHTHAYLPGTGQATPTANPVAQALAAAGTTKFKAE